MNFFSWLAQEKLLTDAALTIRAQVLQPDDLDNLRYEPFFPRRDVDSMKLREMGNIDFRPVSDRREFNARGRQINTITPNIKDLQFIPVESYFQIGEQEINDYMERTGGNATVFRELVGSRIPDRIDELAAANLRRLEIDAFTAWATGTVVTRHPHTGVTTTVSYGFDTDRYATAVTDWDDGAVNAYEELLAWLADGVDALGGNPAGIIMTRAIYNEIQADAPEVDGRPATRAEFEELVRDASGIDLTFYVMEHKLDVYTTGGLETTRTRVWPSQKIALVPIGVAVGNMCYSPVVRAYDVVGDASLGSEIDVRGQTVFREVAGNGRQATWECQVNAFPVPNEDRLWVMDTGIASA